MMNLTLTVGICSLEFAGHNHSDDQIKDSEMGGACSIYKANVNFILEQATKAQMGSRGIALLFLKPRR